MAILFPNSEYLNQEWTMDSKEYEHEDYNFDVICEVVEIKNKKFRFDHGKVYIIKDMPGVTLTCKGFPLKSNSEHQRIRFGVKGMNVENGHLLNLRYIENRSHVQMGVVFSLTIESSKPRTIKAPTLRVLKQK